MKKAGNKDLSELMEEIERSYTERSLYIIWKCTLKPFLLRHKKILKRHAIEMDLSTLSKKGISVFFARLLLDPILLRLFRDSLSSSLQEALNIFTWKEKLSINEFEKRFFIEFSTQSSLIEFHFFPIQGTALYSNLSKYRSFFFFPKMMQERFREIIPYPKEFTLEVNSLENSSLSTFSCEKNILETLHLQEIYFQKFPPKFLKDGTPSRSSLKKFSQELSLKEFYEKENGPLSSLRATFFFYFHQIKKLRNIEEIDPLVILEKIVGTHQLISEEHLMILLPHLRRGSKMKFRKKEAQIGLQFLLSQFPVDGWIAFSNIKEYCLLKKIDLEIFSRKYSGSQLYFTPPTESSFGFTHTITVTEDYFNLVVLEPFLRTYFFFLSALGVVDIAYEKPEMDAGVKEEDGYLSPYNGIQYVRLNALGAYIFGQKKDYISQKKETQLIFDADRLIITIIPTQSSFSLFLSQIGQKITSNKYKISHQSFFKECQTEREVKNHIALLKKHATNELPILWQEFFNELLQRIQHFNPKPEYRVFHMQTPSAFFRLFREDAFLRERLLLAEQAHLLISIDQLEEVKKRLFELGFSCHFEGTFQEISLEPQIRPNEENSCKNQVS